MNNIKILLREQLNSISEDYPSNFSMEEFKTLNTFSSRIDYCQKNLKRISSGSSRIVYQIDDEKVLKLARNKKGLAQNEVEIEYSHYSDIDNIIAKVFEYDENNLWLEAELARKLTEPKFKQITGFNWKDFSNMVRYEGDRIFNPRQNRTFTGYLKQLNDEMWEDDKFTFHIFDFIGSYDIRTYGDLMRINSYGVVKRNGEERVVMIDYGLTNNVYDSYYS